jgi:hypothetical protein
VDTLDKSNNYYLISTKTVILNKYKKEGRYGVLKYKLPEEVYKLIDTSKQFVFEHGPTLTSFVSKMLKAIGIKGGVNVFRHAYLSEQLDGENIKDPVLRKNLFQKMAHSPSVQLQYLRKLKD